MSCFYGTPQSCWTTFKAQDFPSSRICTTSLILSTFIHLLTFFSNDFPEFFSLPDSLEIRLRFFYLFLFVFKIIHLNQMAVWGNTTNPLSCLYAVSSLMSGTCAPNLIHMFYLYWELEGSPLFGGNHPKKIYLEHFTCFPGYMFL